MTIEEFINRWSHARGGAERANYQMFLTELCEALDLPRPDPASDDTRSNDYVFERGVKRRESEGFASTLRIDLYKRGCFILEAKQSRAAQRDDGQQHLFGEAEAASTAATEGRWDVLMRNARKQAEDYAFRLPADHPAPPFIIVCDVGYVFEVYADFSGSGRAYGHFPDRKGFRVRLEDLRRPEIVERLKAIWSDPQSLDPSRHAARVTRQIDATRKTVQAENPDLTLTGLYNVLEKVRAGAALTDTETDVKDRGRVLILKDLHDQIDRATADAYGWPHDLTDEQILERLVALNTERAAEEAAGHVRWLRPDYQIPRFAKDVATRKTGELDLGANVIAIDRRLPAFPKDKGEQVMAIRAVLQASGRPMDAAAVSRAFKRGGKSIDQRVVQALNTLVRYAEITALPNETYAARRAA